MFQRIIDKLYSGMSNVFSIADDILISGFVEQDKDHNATINKLVRVCRWENVKLNKDKVPFQMHQHSIFWQNTP